MNDSLKEIFPCLYTVLGIMTLYDVWYTEFGRRDVLPVDILVIQCVNFTKLFVAVFIILVHKTCSVWI